MSLRDSKSWTLIYLEYIPPDVDEEEHLWDKEFQYTLKSGKELILGVDIALNPGGFTYGLYMKYASRIQVWTRIPFERPPYEPSEDPEAFLKRIEPLYFEALLQHLQEAPIEEMLSLIDPESSFWDEDEWEEAQWGRRHKSLPFYAEKGMPDPTRLYLKCSEHRLKNLFFYDTSFQETSYLQECKLIMKELSELYKELLEEIS